jgi:hypothetical protein
VIAARGSRLTLPSGLAVALAPHSQVLGGCVTGDGRWLTLLVAHRAERQLVMVSLGLAQVMHRRSVPARAAVAVAAGVAAIQIEPRVLRVIDLINNRDLGGVSFDHDVAAFAVGPTGRALAIRDTRGELELHRIDPLFPRPFAAPGRVAASAASRPHAAPVAPRVLLAGDASLHAETETETDAETETETETETDREVRAPDIATAAAGAAVAAFAAPPALDAPITAIAPDPAAAAPALDDLLVHSASAPTAHATDWLCGSGDYLDGGR